MLQEQIANEMQLIPDNRLSEIYDFIHYFRLGLTHEKNFPPPINKRHIGLAKDTFSVPASFFDPLPNEMLNAFEGK